MKKLFFDFEFTGLHQFTTPISVGVASDCGRTFYAEFTDYNKNEVNTWIQENVIANLSLQDKQDAHTNFNLAEYEVKGTKEFVSFHLKLWLSQFKEQAQFVGDVLSYDWILMVSLIADYQDGYPVLPNVYYMPLDISTMMFMLNKDMDVSRKDMVSSREVSKQHNALYDAKIIGQIFDKLNDEKNQYFNITSTSTVTFGKTTLHNGLVIADPYKAVFNTEITGKND